MNKDFASFYLRFVLTCLPRHSQPRPETTVDILTRVLDICPEIAPPEIRAQRAPTIKDIYPIIVEESCGFRPCRKGGPRLELEWKETESQRMPVIHNYGSAFSDVLSTPPD